MNQSFMHQEQQQKFYMQFDGSKTSYGTSIAQVLFNEYGEELQRFAKYANPNLTGNQCEYLALIYALKAIKQYQVQGKIIIQGDSKLVIQQVLNEWNTKDDKMLQMRDRVYQLLSTIPDYELMHIPRAKNTMANHLAQALTKEITYDSLPIDPARYIQVHSTETIQRIIGDSYTPFKRFPNKKYDGMIIDPPYEYVNNERPSIPFTLKPPYPTIPFNLMSKLPISQNLSEKGIVFLWCPGTKLHIAIDLFQAWDLDYAFLFCVWRKLGGNRYQDQTFSPVKKFIFKQEKQNFPVLEPYQGAGWHTAHCYEFVLAGNKSQTSPFRTNIRRSQDLSIPYDNDLHSYVPYEIEEKVYKHSQKPVQFYQMIQDLYDVDNMQWLEVFARKRTPYNYFLDLYGNEIDNYYEPRVSKQYIDTDVITIGDEDDYQNEVQEIDEIPVFPPKDNSNNKPENREDKVQQQQDREVECEKFTSLSEMEIDQFSSLFSDHLKQTSTYTSQLLPENINDYFKGDIDIDQLIQDWEPTNYVYDVTRDPQEQEKLMKLNVGDEKFKPTREIYQILKDNLNSFTWDYPNDMPGTNIAEFEIYLTDYDKPIQEKLRKTTPAKEEFTRQEIEALLKAKVIRVSNSSYASAIVIVSKKTGEYRMCIDFRDLNFITIPDKFPLPRIDFLLSKLKGAKYYVTLDFKSGFWQIRIHDKHKKYTAFITKEGLFEWLCMPFGLRNAPSMFQRVMNIVFRDRLNEGVMVYVDDVVIYGETLEQMYDNLSWALRQIQRANLKLNPKKCYFHVSGIQFLGHNIRDSKLWPDTAKVQALLDMPFPRTKRQMKQFLGMVNYFKKFIPDIDKLSKPLSLMTRQQFEVETTDLALNNFHQIKQVLAQPPALAIPRDTDEFVLHAFWDPEYGLYAVLTVIDLTTLEEAPVEFASKSITEVQSRYSSYEGQLATIVWAIWRWKSWLYSKPFTLVVQENVTRWCLKGKELPPKIAKWALIVQTFDYFIQIRGARQQRALLTKIAKQFANLNTVLAADAGQLSNTICQECKQLGQDNIMLLCSNCELGFHKTCVGTKLGGKDKEKYYCPECHNALIKQAVDPTQDEDLLFFLTYGYPIGQFTKKERTILAARAARYELHGSELHLKVFQPDGSYTTREVPSVGDRYQTIFQFHHSQGHQGVKRTLQHLSNFYYWPAMSRDVRIVLSNCISCATEKARFYDLPVIKPTKVSTVPFTMLAVDCVKFDHYTQLGNLYLVVIVDAYSKWVEATPTRSIGAATTARCLMDFVARYGCPHLVRTDGGKEFEGEFDKLCNLFTVKHIISSPYNSSSNGMVERVNNTIRSSIRKLFNEPYMRDDWDKLLPYALIGIRSCVSRVTNYSPYQIIFGRDMVIPGFLINKEALQSDWTEPDSDSVVKYIKDLKIVHESKVKIIAAGLQEAQQEIQKEIQKDYVPTPFDFQFGDLVLYKTGKPHTKMDAKSKGPYLFIKYTTDERLVAKLFNLKQKIVIKASVSNLAPYGVIQ